MTSGVACNSCGAVQDESPCTQPQDRTPCLHCGSTSRRFSVEASTSISVGASVTSRVISKKEADLISLLKLVFLLSAIYSVARSARVRLQQPPGSIWLSFVDFLYSATTVEKVFKPIVADWRMEYFDALKAKRPLKARWISFRYYWSMLKAMGISQVLSLLSRFASPR
jgi:hypothetical protein